MPPLNRPADGQAYWRSLDELADTPEFRAFVEREFVNYAPELLTSATRRQFLKLMGASVALGGLAGCRWPREEIVPANARPLGRVPGVPIMFATAMELGGCANGLLVESYDGRPIKIEGNDKHPISRGKTNALMQASLLTLYDPDRSPYPMQRAGAGARGGGTPRRWTEFSAFAAPHFGELRQNGGAGLAVLCEPSGSPTLADLRRRFEAALPQARWFEYDPVSRDAEREGTRLAFGKPYRPQLDLAQADLIVSLESDFLMEHPAALRLARDFADRRRGKGPANRLYVIESGLTVTGTNADHRYPVRSQDVALVATHLAAALVELGLEDPALKEAGGAAGPATSMAPVDSESVTELARELLAHRGRSVILAGRSQPPAVHALACILNAALGNVGIVRYSPAPLPERATHAAQIRALVEALQGGQVQTLVIIGGNPVYDAPAELGFDQALAKARTAVHLSFYDDETSQLCTWHVPQTHYLEQWGDGRAWDGTISIVQPLIEPLFEADFTGCSAIELLAIINGDEATRGYEIVRRTMQEFLPAGEGFEQAWRQALHDGFVPNTAWALETPPVQAGRLGEALAKMLAGRSALQPDEFEVVFRPDYKVWDGRFANNGWLQELPDPLTKLTWDNAALMSPVDAKRLGAGKYGDVVRIDREGRAIDIAAYPLPGHAPGSLTLVLGYGRPHAGRIAAGAGVDAYRLKPADGFVLRGVRVKATGEHHALATTQDHHSIASDVGDREAERRVRAELVRKIPAAMLVELCGENSEHADGSAGTAQKAAAHDEMHGAERGPQSVHRPLQLFQPYDYSRGHQWGMAIDLSACIGCGACVVACQAENNIPVVGKEEVALGREMHWIRVDRYFQGSPDSPQVEVVHQPMTCVHCENAPCEGVCPVAATVHDQEGLNVMVYNRCIGTRYCNNNCPFKVRRFNWFYNHHGPKHPREGEDLTNLEKMVFNPDVTVRSRGVMEKCTFCVQRIQAVKIRAKTEGWPSIPDGAITTACAQACPTDAIVFGDLNDPNSRVRKLHQDERAYELLTGLNLRTRLHYLAKVTNRREEGGDRDQGNEGSRDQGTRNDGMV